MSVLKRSRLGVPSFVDLLHHLSVWSDVRGRPSRVRTNRNNVDGAEGEMQRAHLKDSESVHGRSLKIVTAFGHVSSAQ